MDKSWKLCGSSLSLGRKSDLSFGFKFKTQTRSPPIECEPGVLTYTTEKNNVSGQEASFKVSLSNGTKDTIRTPAFYSTEQIQEFLPVVVTDAVVRVPYVVIAPVHRLLVFLVERFFFIISNNKQQ